MRAQGTRITVRTMIVAVAVVAVALQQLLWRADPLPANWNPDEFGSAVREAVDRSGEGNVDARLLAWKSHVDDRPLYVDEALAWCRIEIKGKDRWALVRLCRHPGDGPKWYPSMIYDHPWTPVRFYERPPGNAEVYDFVDAYPLGQFFGAVGPNFRLLSAGVRVTTWYSAIGQRPIRFFASQ
jgi:hypothetical protein